MTAKTVTHVTTPSTDEIETAWWNLMQGELGLDRDDTLRDFVQTMVDHMRSQVVCYEDGEPLDVVSSTEAARRIALAYASLIYSGNDDTVGGMK